ncbi:hypothetical protein N0V90_009375 [Kalmusia sp. IMI 367209]|nr:hypothetical protein N0V90_009375 [Kalmusia sp. IMI 367209]
MPHGRILSKQLRSIVYTSLTRTLGAELKSGGASVSAVAQYETDMLNIFPHIQDVFYARQSELHRQQPCNYDADAEISRELLRWAKQLQDIYHRYTSTVPQPRQCQPTQHNSQQTPTRASYSQQQMQAQPMQQYIQAPIPPNQRTPMASYPQQQMQALHAPHNNHTPFLPTPSAPVGSSHFQQLRPMPTVQSNQTQTVQPLVYPDSRMPPHSAQAAVQQRRGRSPGRPPLPIAQPPLQHWPVHASGYQTPHPARLIPARGWSQSQQHRPNPARVALHQAHLRSPLLRAQSEERFYLYMQSFMRDPQRPAKSGFEKWYFTVTPEQMERIPKDVPDLPGAPSVRSINKDSLVLRLRCVKWADSKLPTEHTWATSDMSWIPYAYFKLNGKNLEQRKKLHHGRDKPIDLTQFVVAGENTLEISIVCGTTDVAHLDYLVAIEILGVESHAAIMHTAQITNHISAETSKQRIKDNLSSTMDDDVAIVESNLTVNLFDPFTMSGICDIPARSKACLHFDCFPLATFLETRSRAGDVSVASEWRCPICNADARPQHLVVDGFFEQVRSKLLNNGLSRTRAIIVEQDGSWKPKTDVQGHVPDAADDDDDVAIVDVQ